MALQRTESPSSSPEASESEQKEAGPKLPRDRLQCFFLLRLAKTGLLRQSLSKADQSGFACICLLAAKLESYSALKVHESSILEVETKLTERLHIAFAKFGAAFQVKSEVCGG